MKKFAILYHLLIFSMLIGGTMGIIKVIVPGMTWLGFRQLIGMGSTFKDNAIPIYAILYGALMSLLEIISSIFLLSKNRYGFKVASITLIINALGCIAATLLGDILAVGSLMIRFLGLYILIKAKRLETACSCGRSCAPFQIK